MTTTPTARPALDVRPMTAEDEPSVLELLTIAMAGGPTGKRTTDYFRWKHRENPFGASPGLVAVHDERVVGVRLFLRWNLVTEGRTIQAVRAVDTATHPDYQRQGIFRRLTLALVEQVRSEGVDLVFNTPNADSKPGYLKLGWETVTTLPIHIRPVRPLAFLRGARAANTTNASGSASAVADASTRPHVPMQQETRLPPASDIFSDPAGLRDLLQQIGPEPRLHTPITEEYLRWRYVDIPGLHYSCVPVVRGGRLVGVGFGRVRRRASLTELTLGDILVRSGDRHSSGLVLRAARRAGVDHVAVHSASGTEVSARLRRCGYLRTPGNGITLVANPLRSSAADALDPEKWRLSLGDLEVF